jgi:hypothetical protein
VAASFNHFGQIPQVNAFPAPTAFQSQVPSAPTNGAFGGLPPLPNIKSMPAPLSAPQGMMQPISSGAGFVPQPQFAQNVNFFSC